MAKYGQDVDRQSAYEMLTAGSRRPPRRAPARSPSRPCRRPAGSRADHRRRRLADADPRAVQPLPDDSPGDRAGPEGTQGASHAARRGQSAGGIGEVLNNPVVTSFMKSLGTSLGGALGRSVFGTRKRRR